MVIFSCVRAIKPQLFEIICNNYGVVKTTLDGDNTIHIVVIYKQCYLTISWPLEPAINLSCGPNEN